MGMMCGQPLNVSTSITSTFIGLGSLEVCSNAHRSIPGALAAQALKVGVGGYTEEVLKQSSCKRPPGSEVSKIKHQQTA